MVIAAIDLGYGHVKYGSIGGNNKAKTGSFPSLVEMSAKSVGQTSTGFSKKALVSVSVKKRTYRVGPDIFEIKKHDARELVSEYPRTDEYQALMLGALHYIGHEEIDVLVLGLPVDNLYMASSLVSKWSGKHDAGGKAVMVNSVKVVPQPLGGLLQRFEQDQCGAPNETHLVIDPGYFTLDWIIVRGLKLNEHRSGTHNESMRACIRMMADQISAVNRKTYTDWPRIERHVVSGKAFQVGKKTFQPRDLEKAADPIINTGIKLMAESLGQWDDIDEITIIGGGSKRYRQAIAKRFKPKKAKVVNQAQFANVLGFLLLGQRMAPKKNQLKQCG